jgi:hypothetical protein
MRFIVLYFKLIMTNLPFNPYIVGNPIKTKEMFFGREDEFLFVFRKIGESKSNQVIVFCGDRRSGKTSILFQILLGRLGERFLPILVDLQILAGIKNDADFFLSVIEVTCSSLAIPGLSFDEIKTRNSGQSAEHVFMNLLQSIQERFPDKTLLFLFDEYELIETKIKEGKLSESIIHLLSGVLESGNRISFIFTGSTNLENRKVDFWKTLLAKSIYKKISYLSYNDTVRLITEPLKGYLTFEKPVIDTIYRLTGGQPFYTQVVCQNLVDLAVEKEKNDVSGEELDAVVKDIVNNPLPQMIYSWSNLSIHLRLVLSALGSILTDSSLYEGTQGICDYVTKNSIRLPFKKEQINILLEDAYSREFIEKNDEGKYRFRMDLFRRWIKKEHSIWKILREAEVQHAKPARKAAIGLAAGVIALLLAAAGAFVLLSYVGVIPGGFASGSVAGKTGAEIQIREVAVYSNFGYFRVLVDTNRMSLSSEGIGDGTKMTIPSLSKGEHHLEFILPATGQRIVEDLDVSHDGQEIRVQFDKPDAASIAKYSEKGTQSADVLTGSLLVSSNPTGAKITIDGKDYGITPNLCQNLASGVHSIELELAGYKTALRKVAIKPGINPSKEDVVLDIASGYVVFKIRPTAIVTFEDTTRIVAQSDRSRQLEAPRLKPLEIQSGSLTFTIENEVLGKRRTITVEIEDGKTVSVDWDIEKEDEPVIK